MAQFVNAFAVPSSTSGGGGGSTAYDPSQVHLPPALIKQIPAGAAAIASFKELQKQPWFQSIVDYTKLPAEGVMNLLGAWQRISVEQLADQAARKVGPYETMMMNSPPTMSIPGLAVTPTGRAQLARDWAAATHPNDPTPELRAEKAMHLEKLMSTDPGLRGKMQNFAVRTAFETLTDPLTYSGVGTAAAAEKLLQAYDVVSRLSLLSKSTPIRTAARVLTTNVAEKTEQAKTAVKGLGDVSEFATPGEKLKHAIARTKAVSERLPADQQTIAAINTARNKAMDASRRLQSSDAELIAKYRPWLEKATKGDWLKKNAEYAQKRGTANLRGIWPDEIEKRLTLGTRPGQEMPLFKLPEPQPGVGREVHQKGDAESILRDMLNDSREQVRRNTIEDALHANTKNLTPQQIEAIANVEPKSGGGGFLHKVSRAQVDAMLATGAPHMRNVGVAGYMALGELGVAKAAYYALHSAIPKSIKDRIAKVGIRGMPSELGQRLEEGGTMHFGLSEPGEVVGATEKFMPGFREFRKASTQALDKWDEALRAVRLEQLDKQFGEKMTDFEKLDRVNQDLGAYNLRPEWTEWAPAIGANFPQWHGYIVPTMVARGLLRNPGRIGRFGRYETNYNDTFFPNEKYRWTFGGPIDEAFSAYSDPLRVATGQYPSYYGGPSTFGAGSLIFRPSYLPTMQRAIEFGAGALPGGTAATEGYFRQFPEIPGGTATGASLAGFYTQKRTPSSMRRMGALQMPVPIDQPPGTPTAAAAAPKPDKSGFVNAFAVPP